MLAHLDGTVFLGRGNKQAHEYHTEYNTCTPVTDPRFV